MTHTRHRERTIISACALEIYCDYVILSLSHIVLCTIFLLIFHILLEVNNICTLTYRMQKCNQTVTCLIKPATICKKSLKIRILSFIQCVQVIGKKQSNHDARAIKNCTLHREYRGHALIKTHKLYSNLTKFNPVQVNMKSQKEAKELKLSVPWGHIAARAWGSPQNSPVLAVHGTLDNAGSFTRLIQLLPDTFYYVAIDLPGHGFSSHFPSGTVLDFFNYLLSIRYVLDELHWDSCAYIGHSFGGQVGVMFSMVFPGRLEKLLVFDALLPRVIPNDLLLLRIRQVHDATLFELNKKPAPLYSREQVLDSLQNRRQFKISEEAALALFDRAVTQVGDKYKYNRDLRLKSFVYPTLNADQYSELIKDLKVPTTIIFVSDSWFQLTGEIRILEFFKKKLPESCSMITVEGNHDVHNNNPERVVSHVLTFLSSQIKSKL